jgi:hypothetical protein
MIVCEGCGKDLRFKTCCYFCIITKDTKDRYHYFCKECGEKSFYKEHKKEGIDSCCRCNKNVVRTAASNEYITFFYNDTISYDKSFVNHFCVDCFRKVFGDKYC